VCAYVFTLCKDHNEKMLGRTLMEWASRAYLSPYLGLAVLVREPNAAGSSAMYSEASRPTQPIEFV